jgi:hypothetical protein
MSVFRRLRRRSPAPQTPPDSGLDLSMLCCLVCQSPKCRPRALRQPSGQTERVGLAVVFGICDRCAAVPNILPEVERRILERVTFHPQSPPGDRAST